MRRICFVPERGCDGEGLRLPKSKTGLARILTYGAESSYAFETKNDGACKMHGAAEKRDMMCVG